MTVTVVVCDFNTMQVAKEPISKKFETAVSEVTGKEMDRDIAEMLTRHLGLGTDDTSKPTHSPK